MPPLILSPEAAEDIEAILLWTEQQFGPRAKLRYQSLLMQAINDVAENADRVGSVVRPEFAAAVRSYHLFYSRNRVPSAVGRLKEPRHVLFYQTRADGTLELSRILHDTMDFSRHLPAGFRLTP